MVEYKVFHDGKLFNEGQAEALLAITIDTDCEEAITCGFAAGEASPENTATAIACFIVQAAKAFDDPLFVSDVCLKASFLAQDDEDEGDE